MIGTMDDFHYPDFNDTYPQDVLRWAINTFGSRIAVVTSFQPTGIVTLHMLHGMGADVRVLTLDTGLLFPETYALMDEVEARWNLRLTRVRPPLTVDEQGREHGAALWERDPDACCQMRKVFPLREALTGFDAWIAGVRRDQSVGRAHTPVVAWDARNSRVKICPFATWTDDMIWAYIHAHELPTNGLHNQGYPSIGCWPCTQAVSTNGYTRAGRWTSSEKIECGIHKQ
jgi:phosphoadenosine phosphosulfate reductase